MVKESKTINGFNSGMGSDYSDTLANRRRQIIELYHVPTDKVVSFKAFITQFSDGYSSRWNDEEVFGRMDPISTFIGTRRIISLGWDVVAATQDEAHKNLERCSLLLSMLYPTYEAQAGGVRGAQTISSGPLFRLRFMNLIENSANSGGTAKTSGLLGKVGGFTYEPDIDDGFFDPLDAISQDGPLQLYPQTIKLNCEFTVLHEHELGFKDDGTVRKDFSKFPYSHGKHNFSVDPETTKKPSNSPTSAADRTRKIKVSEITKRRGGI